MVGVSGEILAALARGATVVTDRQRAARSLRGAVDRANRAAGLTGWAPARVLAWDAWTVGLWRGLVLRGAADGMLLNRTQEKKLWRVAIEADAGLATLRSADALAGLAAEAWAMLARYGGLRRLAGSARNADMEAFERWAGVFQERCRERGYMAQARLEGALRRAGVAGERELVLVGFDRLLPAQRGLLDALREAGCAVWEAGAIELAAARRVMGAADEAGEIRAAARWARGVLERRPGATLGVIVPGLEAGATLRAGIDRVFREVLAPEAQAMQTGGRALPYEFSTGTQLDLTTVGRVAMGVLEWAQGGLAVDGVRELLLSGSFAGGGEVGARAEFEAYELRGMVMLRAEVGVDTMVGWVERSPRRGGLTALLGCLRRLQAVVRRGLEGERSYADWAETMREMLAAAGWVDGGDSVSFQARERWESALDELATLDFEGGRVVYARALEALRGIAEVTTFAPESRLAPVQIMGPEEAAGSRFDAVWFLRAGEFTWPQPVAGSALLAWPLRRDLGMPGTDAGADGAETRSATERIAASCGEIVFSYARQTAEGRQRPSAMLAGLRLEEMEERIAVVDEPVALEVLEDTGRLPPLPDRAVKGGMAVLKAQAACAFHAFAEHRLFATEMEARELGMNASERGQVVHGMLEHFWEEVRKQAVLQAMTTEERRAALERAIETALAKAHIVAETEWDAAYVETQRQRLLRLGAAWLHLEARRATAFTVERRESEQRSVAIGPLTMNLRLDRVDATDEGAVLIDYKTGLASAAAWRGDRPDEPQLPLYAALAGELQLHAVAFGVVRAGDDMKLTGYAEGPGTLSTKTGAAMEANSLAEQVRQWRDVLEGLANDFARGDTRVSPKVYPGSCQYCAHRLICRLDVPSLNADEEGDEGGMEDDLG